MRSALLRVAVAVVAISLAPLHAAAQQTRIASDFEIRQMEQQAAKSTAFLPLLSSHLNLGDARSARNESTLAQAEYRKALDIAQKEKGDSRRAGDLARYATASMYEGIAAAKLGNDDLAFDALEESLRYASNSAKTWNVYASGMHILGRSRKAVSAARNAVAIAEADVAKSPSVANALDLAVYRYSLALSLSDAGERAEAAAMLENVVASLRSKQFDELRRDVARMESFEVYSSARGDASAYISLLNRAQLQLASLYEKSGDVEHARKVYESVLAARSDDATALAALARLARSSGERAKSFEEAFDANPFSIENVRAYTAWVATAKPEISSGSSTGAKVRRSIEEMARGENRAARGTLDELAAKFPDNDVLQYLQALNDAALGDAPRARSRRVHIAELRNEIERRLAAMSGDRPAFLAARAKAAAPTAAELRQLVTLFDQNLLTPEERQAIDAMTLTGTALFDASATPAAAGQTIFESGTIEGLPFRFSQPTTFAGTFAASTALRLTYRLLGVTEVNGADALLLEPLKVEVAR